MADAPEFTVLWSPAAQDALRSIRRSTHPRVVAGELGEIVRALDERLRREPSAVGEIYRSRGPIEDYAAVHDSFLAINFAIDTLRKLVLVRRCRISGPPV